MEFISTNIAAAWISMAVGCVWGAVLGLFFHRSEWLGGYSSFPRRLLRLGHIACFGLALLNIAFAATVHGGFVSGSAIEFGSHCLLLALITMPLVCALTAWHANLRHFFFIPVLSTVLGIFTVLISLPHHGAPL